VFEIVRILELSPIPVSTGSDSIRLRIEVVKDLRRGNCFRARLLRWDTYSITPSFGYAGGVTSADEEILVLDPFWDSPSATAATAREALELVLSRLREQLPNADIPETVPIEE
jgi:hypothetical protein